MYILLRLEIWCSICSVSGYSTRCCTTRSFFFPAQQARAPLTTMNELIGSDYAGGVPILPRKGRNLGCLLIGILGRISLKPGRL